MDLTPTPETVAELRRDFEAELAVAATARDLQAVRDRYLSRKSGIVPGLMKAVSGAAPADRPALGRLANSLKRDIDTWLAEKRAALDTERAPADAIDATLPGRVPALGRRHPLTTVRDRMEAIFVRMGFAIVEGPEVEDEWHCFDALNMPSEHPARDMQDTLYLASPFWAGGSDAGGQDVRTMLRTHTHKICVYHGRDEGELYDLAADPTETHNLWRHPAHAETRLAMLKRCFDASVFTMDPLPPREAIF